MNANSRTSMVPISNSPECNNRSGGRLMARLSVSDPLQYIAPAHSTRSHSLEAIVERHRHISPTMKSRKPENTVITEAFPTATETLEHT